jgi:hypothetical protein
MAEIKNVPQFCDQLMQDRADREDMLTSGQLPTTTEDRLTDLAEDDFLAGSVQAVDDWLANAAGSEFEQISVLEVNGFLASAQNSYGLFMRDAFARRFGRLRMQQLLYRPKGVLDDQLKLVGTIVDPPMVLQLVGEAVT